MACEACGEDDQDRCACTRDGLIGFLSDFRTTASSPGAASPGPPAGADPDRAASSPPPAPGSGAPVTVISRTDDEEGQWKRPPPSSAIHLPPSRFSPPADSENTPPPASRKLAERVSGLAMLAILAALGVFGWKINTEPAPLPSWSSTLISSGLVVQRPTASAGFTSPVGVVREYLQAMDAGDSSGECDTVEPSAQVECQQLIGLDGGNYGSDTTFSKAKVGYAVISGNEALVALTGTFCNPGADPQCQTITDPGTAFETVGISFQHLWSVQSTAQAEGSAANGNFLAAAIEVGHSWYVYQPD